MIAALITAWVIAVAFLVGAMRKAPTPPARPHLFLVRLDDDPAAPVSHRTLERVNRDHPHGA